MGSSLLVCNEDMFYLIAVFIKFVIQEQCGTARITENGVNAMFKQDLHD